MAAQRLSKRRRKGGIFDSGDWDCGSAQSESRRQENRAMLRKVILGGSAPSSGSALTRSKSLQTDGFVSNLLLSNPPHARCHSDRALLLGPKEPEIDLRRLCPLPIELTPSGVDVEVVTEMAARGTNDQLSECLLKCTTILINDRNSIGLTPLQTAVFHENLENARLLLDLGAQGTLAYPHDGGTTVIHMAVRKKSHEMLQMLLTHPKIVEAGTERTINRPDDDGFTPLHEAIDLEDLMAMRLLIEIGNASVDSGDSSKSMIKKLPLLSLAIHRRDPGACSLLLKKGAEPNICDENGWTPLMVLAREWAEEEEVSSSLQIMADLLLDAGAQVDQAPRHSPTQHRATVLHVCASYGSDTLIRILSRRKPYINLDVVDGRGKTPLHMAVACLRLDVMRTLILLGVDCDARDSDHKTSWENVHRHPSYPSILHAMNVAVKERDGTKQQEAPFSGRNSGLLSRSFGYFGSATNQSGTFGSGLPELSPNSLFSVLS